MTDTERLDFLAKMLTKPGIGEEVLFWSNGKSVQVGWFERTGYGYEIREAIDDLKQKIESEAVDSVARKLTS